MTDEEVFEAGWRAGRGYTNGILFRASRGQGDPLDLNLDVDEASTGLADQSGHPKYSKEWWRYADAAYGAIEYALEWEQFKLGGTGVLGRRRWSSQ